MSRAGSKLATGDYEQALGSFFRDTPKSVFAALAFDLIGVAPGQSCDAPATERIAYMINQWQTLYNAGIIPQKPPTTRHFQSWDGRRIDISAEVARIKAENA